MHPARAESSYGEQEPQDSSIPRSQSHSSCLESKGSLLQQTGSLGKQHKEKKLAATWAGSLQGRGTWGWQQGSTEYPHSKFNIQQAQEAAQVHLQSKSCPQRGVIYSHRAAGTSPRHPHLPSGTPGMAGRQIPRLKPSQPLCPSSLLVATAIGQAEHAASEECANQDVFKGNRLPRQRCQSDSPAPPTRCY